MTMRGMLGVLMATAVVTTQGGWRPVQVEMLPGAGVSAFDACRTPTGAALLRPGSGGAAFAEALCVSTGIVQCSVPGAEPLDIDIASACRGASAAMQPAVRFLVPTWTLRTPATVEWRAWGDSVSHVLAARTVTAAMLDPWPLAAGARLMRVHRAGASPVTLIVPAVTPESAQDLTMRVPPALPGGELLLAFGPAERAEAVLTLRGPQERIVGINGAAFVSVPGLPAGDYELRFGPPDTPIGRPIPVSVVHEATTEFSPRLPVEAGELRISGLVTLNGEPMTREPLEVLATRTDRVWTVTTDDRGRYSLTVPAPDVYVVRLATGDDLGVAEVDRPVDVGETIIDLDLAGADVRLSFLVEGALPEDPVRFEIDGPVRYSGIVDDPLRPIVLRALPLGTYVVYGHADPDLVSSAATVQIDANPGVRAVTLNLRPQRATLAVVDAPGARARSGGTILRALADGAFDVRRLAPGAEVIVRAPGRVPACVVLAADAPNTVTLSSSLAPLTVFLPGAAGLRVPPGRIRLADVDRCTVPLEEFDWRRVDGGFAIANLPLGVSVTYEYGSQTYRATAPGTLEIR